MAAGVAARAAPSGGAGARETARCAGDAAAATATSPARGPRGLPAALLAAAALALLARPACARESAEAALSRLQRGNARFVERAADGVARDLAPHVNGQRPHTIVLSCSDSRVPVEMVFEQSMGDLFVVRVAGQALDSSVLASIEYAIENLDVHNLVVLGHEGCGAIAAVINTPAGASTGSAHLDALLSDIRPRLAAAGTAPGRASKSVLRESAMNALGVAADLPRRSPVVHARVAADKLIVRAALYHLGTGRVEWLQPWLLNDAGNATAAAAAAAGHAHAHAHDHGHAGHDHHGHGHHAAAGVAADGAATAGAASEPPFFGEAVASEPPIAVSAEDLERIKRAADKKRDA